MASPVGSFAVVTPSEGDADTGVEAALDVPAPGLAGGASFATNSLEASTAVRAACWMLARHASSFNAEPGLCLPTRARITVTLFAKRVAYEKNAPLADRARVNVLAMRGSGRIIFFGGSRDGRALDAIDGVVEAAERGANSVHVRRFGQP